jgi:hypothetical protein
MSQLNQLIAPAEAKNGKVCQPQSGHDFERDNLMPTPIYKLTNGSNLQNTRAAINALDGDRLGNHNNDTAEKERTNQTVVLEIIKSDGMTDEEIGTFLKSNKPRLDLYLPSFCHKIIFVICLICAGIFCFSSAFLLRSNSIYINPKDNRGAWEGFGTSLAWWANSIRDENLRNLYADIFFTANDSILLPNGKRIPGLGLNIVRYNIGASGKTGDYEVKEYSPSWISVNRRIEGYWLNPDNWDPTSSSWDWNRDANQRNMLKAAYSRGATKVEFFSNAPMWWMTKEGSANGGAIDSKWNQAFCHYAATVVSKAKSSWDIDVYSYSIFNGK